MRLSGGRTGYGPVPTRKGGAAIDENALLDLNGRLLPEDDDEAWELPVEILAGEDRSALVSAIGEVALTSAELENGLRLVFYRLMVGDEALLIADGESPDWLIRNCVRLIRQEHRHPSAVDHGTERDVQVVLSCKRLFEVRGAIVHSSWQRGPGDLYVALASKKLRGLRAYRFSLADLMSIATLFQEKTRQIAQLARW